MLPEYSVLISFRHSHCPIFLPLHLTWWPCFLVGQCHFSHLQRRTVYCLPPRACGWTSDQPNIQEEVLLQEAKGLLHVSALLAWEQATRDPQHDALHRYAPQHQLAGTTGSSPEVELKRGSLRQGCCCLGSLSMTALSHGSPSGAYRSQAAGQMKSPGSAEEQPHLGQEKRAPGKALTGRAQLEPSVQNRGGSISSLCESTLYFTRVLP